MAYILANDGIAQDAKEILESLGHMVDIHHYEGQALTEKIKEVDCIIVRSATKIRTALIDAAHEAGKLKLIIRAGVGIDNIDYEYAEASNIMVRNTPTASSNAVAELTIGHMLTIARYIDQANVSMKKGEWLKKQYTGVELSGKRFGLMGFGRIAQLVAQKAMALGMIVSYYSLHGPKDVLSECIYKHKADILKDSDFISLHIPYDKELGAFIGKKEFAIMKKNTYLINTARGGVVDEDALLDALDKGIVARAALDVYQDEPTKNDQLIKDDRISLTPHIGASTYEAQARIGLEVVDIINKYI